jgi:hypothetical protein
VVDFGFLGWKYFQALNALHSGFPFLEVGEIIELIDNPIKEDDIAAFKVINFLNFLLLSMIIYFALIISLDFLPSRTKVINSLQQLWWDECFIDFIVRGVSEPNDPLPLKHLFLN